MSKYAGRLYNKDEKNVLGVVCAENKRDAYAALKGLWGKTYQIGQIFLDKTDRAVGEIHKVVVKEPDGTCCRHYGVERYCELLEENISHSQRTEDKKYQEWREAHPEADQNTFIDGYKKSNLGNIGLKPIEPGSKYDRVYYNERGQRITRKEWKRRRKVALASQARFVAEITAKQVALAGPYFSSALYHL